MKSLIRTLGFSLLFALNPAIANQPDGLVFSVDAGPGCTYATIQEAIDSVFNEIRVVSGTYDESLTIENKTVSIIGGYNSCADAIQNNLSADANAESVVIQSIGGTTMFVRGTDSSSTVELENLTIRDGNGFISAGGINISGSNFVVARNVRVTDNTASARAAGISVFGNQAKLVLHDTQIDNNTVVEPFRAESGAQPEGGDLPEGGGGVWCFGSSVTVREGTSIHSNSAKNGGGILASNCDLEVLAGNVGEAFGLFVNEGIFLNSASNHGGGIYAIEGSQVTIEGGTLCDFFPIASCQGDPNTGAAFVLNEADSDVSGAGDGGAIYIGGEETSVIIQNTVFASNSAYEGGAIAAWDGASVIIRKSPGESCWSTRGYDCVAFLNNSASDAGALFMGPDVNATIAQAYFSGNTGGGNTAVYSGFRSTTLMEGNMIVNNGATNISAPEGSLLDHYIVRQLDGTLTFAHNTVADNGAANAILYPGATPNNDVELNLFNSLILNGIAAPVFEFSGNVVWDAECTFVDEQDSAPNPNGLFVEQNHAAVFLGDDHDSYSSPYHLKPSSFAEDFCDPNVYTPVYTDIDDEERAWDNLPWGNISGPLDAGADETYLADIIVRNGME